MALGEERENRHGGEGLMPYSAKAIANAFINKASQNGEQLSPLKLQKLIYYASGYFIAAYDQPLIDCSIEAWTYGPVVPEVYREFRDLGSEPIVRWATDIDWGSGAFTPVPIPTQDARVMNVVDFVWNTYGKYSGLQLSDMTHAPNTPWDLTRRSRPGIKNADISENDLKSYFKQFVTKQQA
jgi:uncharacterized phage-associated protein